MTRSCLAVFAFAAAMLCAAAAPAAPVKMAKIASETPAYSITVEYPQTGVKAIDDDIAAWARAQADAFLRHVRQKPLDDSQWSFAISARVVRNDAQMFEVVFDIGDDAGYAHPMEYMETLNYLVPDGSRFYLPEALGPGGFKRIGNLTFADLKAKMTAGVDMPDETSLRIVTAPRAENFAAFAFTPSELIVYFQPGAVSSYEDGAKESHIPLAKLAGILRADWRAPLPSFDCAKAVSGIEKAICADRMIARLDRQVAEIYSHMLLATDDRAQGPIKAAQRAFIAKRNKDCEGLAFGATDRCLSAAYTARLAALKVAQENP